jgi:hypothetical protein
VFKNPHLRGVEIMRIFVQEIIAIRSDDPAGRNPKTAQNRDKKYPQFGALSLLSATLWALPLVVRFFTQKMFAYRRSGLARGETGPIKCDCGFR